MARRRRNAYQRYQASQQRERARAGSAEAAARAAVPGSGAPGAPPAGPAQIGPPPPDYAQIAYETEQRRGVQYADAQATYDRGRINRDYGFTSSGAVDPNNPYSRAALMERSFKEGQRGDTNSYASQGQLYSGALQNQRNSRAFGYLSDRNSLRNEYSDALNQTGLNQLGAYTSAGSAVSQSQIDALLRALGR